MPLRAATRTPQATIARAWCRRWRPASGGCAQIYTDLYWVRIRDQITPVEDGLCDPPGRSVGDANTLAQLRGWSHFIGLQIEIQPDRANRGTRAYTDGEGAEHRRHRLVPAGWRRAHRQVSRQRILRAWPHEHGHDERLHAGAGADRPHRCGRQESVS
jgi:hypothetical protein